MPVPPGIIFPLEVNQIDYDRLDFRNLPNDQGHQNKNGLIEAELLKLMKAGFLIDLAHMSEKSQEQALHLSDDNHNYPLMNSHSGMRPDEWKKGSEPEWKKGPSERDMSKSNVKKLSNNSGVFGMGTSGYRDKDSEAPRGDQIEQWIADYWDLWSAMNFRGVAIGTDANGLSPLIPNSSKSFSYPFYVRGNPSRL